LAAGLIACGGDDVVVPGGEGGGGGDTPNPLAVAECEPNEAAQPDGSCIPVGVKDCGAGFAADGLGGCAAVVPEADCPLGQMKVLGETGCVEVHACSGRWGSAPIDASTVFVDATYAGNDSDGTQAKPLTSLQQAVDLAPAGGLVAVAAGDYSSLQAAKPVVVWGACPTEVTIQGGFTSVDPVAVFASAPGVELHAVSLSDSLYGLVVVAPDVLAEDVVIHDLDFYGVFVDGDFAPGAYATIRHSAVVRATGTGVAAFNAGVTLEDVYIADTLANPDDSGGRAVALRPGTVHAEIDADGLVVERSKVAGLLLRGVNGVLDRVYVADTLGLGDGSLGSAVSITGNASAGTGIFPSEVAIDHLLVERARRSGLSFEDTLATASDVTIRDIEIDPVETVTNGQALNVIAWTAPTSLSLSHGLIERSVASGVFVGSNGALNGGQGVATVDIDGLIVHDVAPRADGEFGFGLYAQVASDGTTQSTLTLRDSLVERVSSAGVVLLDSVGTLNRVHIRDMYATPTNNEYGDGVMIRRYFVGAPPLSFAATDVVIEHAARAGISNFGADVLVSDALLSCNTIHLNGEANYEGIQFTFTFAGDTRCGCDVEQDCRVLSSGLAPPPLVE
jgi:hypothetical protein